VTSSTSKKTKRRPWWLIVVVILVVGGLVAVAMAMTTDDDDSNNASGPSPGTIGDPEIHQAKWRFTVKRAPGKKLSKSQRESLPVQRKKLKSMAQDVFDAMFLSPERRSEALKANFTTKARRSYQRTGAGVPKGADDIRIRRRSAWIVIDQTVRATMNINIVARGQAEKGPFATEHRSLLYVAREKGGWKVFGYKIDQGPFKKGKASGKDDKANKNQDKSKAKNKKNKKIKKNKKGTKKRKRSGNRNQRKGRQ
jgi:hypothetical protein